MHNPKSIINPLMVALFFWVLVGCAPLTRLPAVPVEQSLKASIPDIPNARFWVADDPNAMIDVALAALAREQNYLLQTGKDNSQLPPVNYLAVSGGGDNGAFGAGLLVGWTEQGSRPEFKIVTGISTGALIAPFAFLGPDYDTKLKQVYTTIGPKDIQETRGLLNAALTSDGLADNTPLYQLIAKYIDAAMLATIAEEYQKGRLLFIATTNLDARKPVIWNMGAIAAANTPASQDLFHRIMLASAAIPGVFSPVMIDVEVNGESYQEMHVDGGTITQVFVFPPNVVQIMRQRNIEVDRQRIVYIIRNARLDPEWVSVERKTLSIAGRAISSLIHTQGLGDLYRIYATSLEERVDYNLAFIGSDFQEEKTEEFDTVYMGKLFDYGYRAARKGYRWEKRPPR